MRRTKKHRRKREERKEKKEMGIERRKERIKREESRKVEGGGKALNHVAPPAPTPRHLQAYPAGPRTKSSPNILSNNQHKL